MAPAQVHSPDYFSCKETCGRCGHPDDGHVHLPDEASLGPAMDAPVKAAHRAATACSRCGHPDDGHLHLSYAGTGVPRRDQHGWPLGFEDVVR
jgi:hypothetical protein